MNWFIHHWRLFIKDPWQARYIVLLLPVNALGSIYGYYWYYEQLISTNKLLWFFVPDSPLATTLFAVVLLLWLLGYRSTLLNLIALTANIKYGLWAVVMISDFWIKGGMVEFSELILWVSHLGMAAQGILYLRADLSSIKKNAGRLLLMLTIWLLFNDFIDYYLEIYPYLYYLGQETLGKQFAVGISLLLIASVSLFRRKKLIV